MPRWNGTAEERFWRHVQKLDSCWEWRAAKSSTGYGQFYAGKRYAAHRYAYELANGPIPDGMVVMHSCDNRSCVNPAHLSIGTKLDNSRDMARKRRYRIPGYKGEQHGEAKLTDAAVEEILTTHTKGRDLATKYGVSESAISHVRCGKSWTHVRKRVLDFGGLSA